MDRRREYGKERILFGGESIFYIVSILFAVFFCFAGRFRDDVEANLLDGGTIIGYWQKSAGMYQTWSSRILINFTIFIFTDHANIFWAVFMGISMFVLLKAFSILFAGGDVMLSSSGRRNGDGSAGRRDGRKNGNDRESLALNRINSHVIACLVLLYPFQDLSTAGWISTMTTYFSPAAFGFMSLVPIKKMFCGWDFAWWEYAVYALCLLYGADNEQVMVVVLGSYIAAMGYFYVQKYFIGRPYAVLRKNTGVYKGTVYCWFLLLLAVGRCLLTLFCPGNANRTQAEVTTWFPTYGMLDTVDKADLGIFTALKWLLFNGHAFVISISVCMAFFVWKKYDAWLMRLLSLVPAAVMVFMGPVLGALASKFPVLRKFAADISYYGLVTAENRGGTRAFLTYFMMGSTIVILCLLFFLLLREAADLLTVFILLAAGTASRAAMGFSPTIYASGDRTCSVMSFCVMAAAILMYAKNAPKELYTDGRNGRILLAADVVMAAEFWQLGSFIINM